MSGDDRYRIVFSGAGGQGIITASIILAEAAVLHEGWNAVQTQSYGPEARGSTTRADVILSPGEIDYPKVIQPNILVCLSQDSYDKYSSIVRPGGLLLTDNHYVRQRPNMDARQLELPLFQAVNDALGTGQPLNLCMLGAMVSVTGVVAMQSLRAATGERFSGEAGDRNLRALELGAQLVESVSARYRWT
jgi:2-oxoglutarate ferredoxin oxidoreductase subunit gamma